MSDQPQSSPFHIVVYICITFQDVEKRTALHAAAYCGDAEIVDLLILSGANVNHKDFKWRGALHRACCSKSEVSNMI